MAKSKQIKTEYKLPNPLVYRLSNQGYTIYHRAALGGLAATIHAWGKNQPDKKITAKIERDQVSIAWDESLSDKEFLRILLENSFRLTADKLIDLPGQQIDRDKDDLRIAIHNGIRKIFLQHTQTYSSEGIKRLELKSIDDLTSYFLSFQKLSIYAHMNEKKMDFMKEKTFPSLTSISQWMIPGITDGAKKIKVSTEEAILLMYLMVGCAIFQLDSQFPKVKKENRQKKKAQACLIVPNVVDLVAFSYAVGIINAENQNFERFSTNSYLNRVVGGAEEAALKFLLDYKMSDFSEAANCIDGCIAIAMGKAAWVENQVTRNIIARVRGDYAEIKVFEAARILGKAKVWKTNVVPSSAIPELVAANLAAERHWCFGFKTLVSEKKDFERMNFLRGGLQKMKEAIENPEDRLIIKAFHEAWNNTMGELGERAKKGEFIFNTKVENEREKMRNAILRAKTPDILAGWFLRFCADASKEASVRTFQQNGEEIRKFIFNQRNFDRFQNLCLFALVSYAGDENKQRKNVGDKTQDNTNINQSETTNTIQGV